MESRKNKGLRLSRVSCCVVGCHNNYANTTEEIKFYSFPNKPYERTRRETWIKSVRRLTASGKPWVPNKFDRICSKHFVDNSISNIELSPSYNPTIFPEVYKATKINSRSQRFERTLRTSKRKSYISESPASTNNANKLFSNEELTSYTELADTSKCTVACSVSLPDPGIVKFTFECHFSKDSCDVGVQANIARVKNIIETSDKCVGNCDEIMCTGFHGISSVIDDKQLSSLAGTSFSVFNLLLLYLTHTDHGNVKVSTKNKVLLFLMKLKLGLSYRALGVFFQIHASSVSRIFINVLNELVQKLGNFVFWPDRETVIQTMPKTFLINYPKCRVVIDCSEIKIERPCGVDNQVYTYSNYKGTFTAKFLVAINPNGFISFVSKCYGGRSSDSFITNSCGVLDLLEPGDIVLADKGFPGIKCTEDVIVVMPPFVHNGTLTVEEVEKTYSIASVRIHVERSIQRIKTYNILHKIPHSLFPYIDMIVRMCCILANLQPPIIKEDDGDD